MAADSSDNVPPVVKNLTSRPLNLQGGHRHRLRQRFLKDPDALHDYELVELLLFSGIVRADVKPLAKLLLSRFRTLNGIVNAPVSELEAIAGLGQASITALKVVAKASVALKKNQVLNVSVLDSLVRVLDYFHKVLANDPVEQFRLLYLNTRKRVLAKEILQYGIIDSKNASVRHVVDRVLDLHASSVILAHLYPGYVPPFTAADQDVMIALKRDLGAIHVIVEDLLKIGPAAEMSLKSLNMY